MSNVVISAYVPVDVADKIAALAKSEDRSKSKVAGRILAEQLNNQPAPSVNFARVRGGKGEQKK